jgi:hypothetical protein
LSQDPIGLAGNNPTLYGYVKDTNSWLDEFGLECGKAGKGKKRGPKTKAEGGPHNDKIGETAKKLEDDGWTIIEGGNRRPEQLHTTGGLKNRRPDIVATKNGKTKVVNVGKKGANGLPVKREQEALNDLKKIFDDVYFEAYN